MVGGVFYAKIIVDFWKNICYRLFRKDGCVVNEFGGNPIIDLESTQLVLGRFVKIKDKEMERKREFYPMITQTVKTLIQVSTQEDKTCILELLKNYPYVEIKYKTPVTIAVLNELDRQYARWDKGGNNGK